MSRLRERVERVDRILERMRPASVGEVWYRDRGFGGDGLAHRVGSGEPGLTIAQYDARPADRDRLLVELVDEGEP